MAHLQNQEPRRQQSATVISNFQQYLSSHHQLFRSRPAGTFVAARPTITMASVAVLGPSKNPLRALDGVHHPDATQRSPPTPSWIEWLNSALRDFVGWQGARELYTESTARNEHPDDTAPLNPESTDNRPRIVGTKRTTEQRTVANGNGDGDEDDDGNKNSSRPAREASSLLHPPRCLACPYAKRYPLTTPSKACKGAGFQNIDKLKQVPRVSFPAAVSS